MTIVRLTEGLLNQFFALVPRERPTLEQARQARLIAHRGAHDNGNQRYENTHAAFTEAETAGCWGIEFDIHATKDGILVVNHDPTLSRLWGVDKCIDALTFAELRSVAPLVPSLAEVVERYGKRMHLFIELKAPFKAEDALAEVLSSLEPGRDYHLITLEESVLTRIVRFPRTIMLLVAEHDNVQKFCRLSLKKHYGGVLGHYLLLTNKKINRLRMAKQRTGVGMVNSTFSLYRELCRDMEWIFSDNAKEVSESLGLLIAEDSSH